MDRLVSNISCWNNLSSVITFATITKALQFCSANPITYHILANFNALKILLLIIYVLITQNSKNCHITYITYIDVTVIVISVIIAQHSSFSKFLTYWYHIKQHWQKSLFVAGTVCC